MENKVITIKEKENYPRVKEEFSVLTARIIPHDLNVILSEQVKQGATLKIPKPLVEEIDGPFDEKGNKVFSMMVGKIYIFKIMKYKKSIFSLLKNIWWAKQLDNGDITDLEYQEGVNPYLDKNGIVSFKYKAKDCGKVRIFAYVVNPIKKVSIECDVFYDDYIKAIKAGRIFYTCNCGWIDKTHAFTDTKRTEFYIGAKNLWKQILEEKETKSNYEKGFKVTYRQDASVFGFNIRSNKILFCKRKLV